MVVAVWDRPLGNVKIDNTITATKAVETNEVRETFNDRITPLRAIGGLWWRFVFKCCHVWHIY